MIGGIQNCFLLQDDEALILAAIDEFVDKSEDGMCNYYILIFCFLFFFNTFHLFNILKIGVLILLN